MSHDHKGFWSEELLKFATHISNSKMEMAVFQKIDKSLKCAHWKVKAKIRTNNNAPDLHCTKIKKHGS